MSEETNETLGNDEAMDITEIETSHSEAAPEARRTYGAMSSSEFEAKLTEFFNKHQKSKLRLVPRIVREFEGNEGEVLEHLHNKYVLGITSAKGGKKKGGKKKLAVGTGHGDGHSHGDSHAEIEGAEAKPKSKKKMIIIIVILVVVLGGGGAAAFMFKDKLFGGHGHGTEHGAAAGHDAKAGEHGAADHKAEPATPAVVDSATTGGTDTTAATTTAQPAAGAEHGAGEHGGGH